MKFFEVERLLNKRTVQKKNCQVIQYLVRWLGYGLKWNHWYDVKDLDNAGNLVEDYKANFQSWRSKSIPKT